MKVDAVESTGEMATSSTRPRRIRSQRQAYVAAFLKVVPPAGEHGHHLRCHSVIIGGFPRQSSLFTDSFDVGILVSYR